MRIAISPKANAVIIDGKGASVDCSQLLSCIHAIEWDSNYAMGHIEYVNDRFAREIEYLSNETITDFGPYEDFIEAWKTSVAEAEEAARQKELAMKEAAEKAREALPPLNLTFK